MKSPFLSFQGILEPTSSTSAECCCAPRGVPSPSTAYACIVMMKSPVIMNVMVGMVGVGVVVGAVMMRMMMMMMSVRCKPSVSCRKELVANSFEVGYLPQPRKRRHVYDVNLCDTLCVLVDIGRTPQVSKSKIRSCASNHVRIFCFSIVKYRSKPFFTDHVCFECQCYLMIHLNRFRSCYAYAPAFRY